MNDQLILKNMLRELRVEKGLSQSELAEMVGVRRETIVCLENGRYNPSIMLAHKIAQYFGMTIEEVFLFGEE